MIINSKRISQIISWYNFYEKCLFASVRLIYSTSSVCFFFKNIPSICFNGLLVTVIAFGYLLTTFHRTFPYTKKLPFRVNMTHSGYNSKQTNHIALPSHFQIAPTCLLITLYCPIVLIICWLLAIKITKVNHKHFVTKQSPKKREREEKHWINFTNNLSSWSRKKRATQEYSFH